MTIESFVSSLEESLADVSVRVRKSWKGIWILFFSHTIIVDDDAKTDKYR